MGLAYAKGYVDPAPLTELNTTPLIDVMLVLLVMLIITIPPQSHAVKVDLPNGPPPTVVEPDRVKNELVVTAAGATLWNGRAVTRSELAALLVATATMEPRPELHLQPEAGARYQLVDEVLGMTSKAGVTRMGFVGNQNYANAF